MTPEQCFREAMDAIDLLSRRRRAPGEHITVLAGVAAISRAIMRTSVPPYEWEHFEAMVEQLSRNCEAVLREGRSLR